MCTVLPIAVSLGDSAVEEIVSASMSLESTRHLGFEASYPVPAVSDGVILSLLIILNFKQKKNDLFFVCLSYTSSVIRK
jgi:hypothetical protein